MRRTLSISWYRRRFWQRVVLMPTGLALVLGLSAVPAQAAPAPAAPAAAAVGSVLVFHGPAAGQQDPVARAAAVLTEIGQQNGLTVDTSSDPAVFTPANLGRYRGVVFLSAEGVALSRDAEAALQGYIRAGGGFLGVGDAAKAAPDSTWFTGLVGTRPLGSVRTPLPVTQPTASGENPPNET
ncbi:ThuA domain-containing protein, partial [Actinophytocola sp.]|uniref:ThuA domain-containing protein n=1 Tax=Actinophytocola sp. TaxID=1872138 RepID=UPI002D7F9BF4